MKLIRHVFLSSIGKKYIMAVTGLFLFLFVAGHMIGNLQIFLGAEPINRYAHFLQSLGELLWVIRLSLLGIIALHIWSAIALALENRAARPVAYATRDGYAASYASRTMILSGFIIAAFVVYHLLHYTVKAPVSLTGQDFHTLPLYTLHSGTKVPDVYRMMIVGFSQPVVAIFYIIAVSLLSFHLGHGVAALFQSLGFKSQAWTPVIEKFGTIAAWVLVIGYASIPASVLFGLVK